MMEDGTAIKFEEIRAKKKELVENGECYTPYYMWLDGYERGLDEGFSEALTMRVNHPPKDESVFPNEYVEATTEDETVLTLSQKLYTSRKRLGLSQAEFGKKYGLAQNTVSHIECTGKCNRLTRKVIDDIYREVFRK